MRGLISGTFLAVFERMEAATVRRLDRRQYGLRFDDPTEVSLDIELIAEILK
jgi:hypothetical protein